MVWETIFMFLKAFAVGGAICTIAQLLINYTKITSGKILVSFFLTNRMLAPTNLLVNAIFKNFKIF